MSFLVIQYYYITSCAHVKQELNGFRKIIKGLLFYPTVKKVQLDVSRDLDNDQSFEK